MDDIDIPLPVYFYSRKFHGLQIRYTVVHKEALGVISTLNHLPKLLFSFKLYIYTDSLNLSNLQSSSLKKLQRYYMMMSDFDMKINMSVESPMY